ncbi:MAG: hypothetical protein QM817_14395 [Archangium sp.]
MTFDQLGGTLVPFADVAKLFPREDWLELGDQMEHPDRPTPLVRVIEGGLSIDELEGDDGSWALVVHGDLHATGDLDFSTSDYRVSLLVVRGNVRARNFRFTNGANCFISGELRCDGYVLGRYGDESARLVVSGPIIARGLLLDHVTGAHAAEYQALVDSSDGWGLPQDFAGEELEKLVVPDALWRDRFDLSSAWQVINEGRELFLPGVEDRIRAARKR